MIAVYAAAGGLTLIAIAWVLHWARRAPGTALDGGDVSAAIYLDRERELAAEARRQGMADADASALQAELAANLASELQGDEGAAPGASGKPATRAPLAPIAAAAAIAGIVGLALYAQWGEPDATRLAQVVATLQAPSAANADLAAAEASLARRDARAPGDGSALFYQGYARLRMGDYAAADALFNTLHGRIGAARNVDVVWAQASYMAAGGRVTAETRAIIDRVLAANPHNLTMLELLATDALRRGDYAAAEKHLASAAGHLAPGPQGDAFREALALAKQRTGAAPAPSAGESPQPAAPNAPAIIAQVTLSPDFDVAATAPVFVIARTPSGAGPPLAVRRLAAGDLPARVVLTDADAMLPGRTLSQQDNVEVLARVSLSGAPTRNAGDLESQPATTRPGAEPIALHVERVVP